MLRLMIKTHAVTGLKYLCVSSRDDYLEYCGSGTRWRRHLVEHGPIIETEVLFETTSKVALRKKGLKYSKRFGVVDSSEWANLCEENGGGGNTVSGKMWITNGVQDKYTDTDIPEGWHRGRSTGAFSVKGNQSKFSSRSSKFSGKRHSTKTKDKMSTSHKGIVFSDEWKNNISISLSGIPKSKKHRKALRVPKTLKTVTCACGKTGKYWAKFAKHYNECVGTNVS
jgi:hypothetical protein